MSLSFLNQWLAIPLCSLALAASTHAEDGVYRLPPITTPVGVAGVPIAVVASGTVARSPKLHDMFQVDLTADLKDLQRNLLPLLRAEMDRNDKCGDRIALQEATLMPAAPAGLLTARLHYERYACAKALGKEIVKRLVGGNATVEVRLTPHVEDHQMVKLTAEVTVKDADGSLAEVLGSGDFGDKLRDKITTSLQKALRKATDRNATLPPALREIASLDEARFADNGNGALALQVLGTIRLSPDQVKGIFGALGPAPANTSR